MRGAALIVLAVLGACQREPDFDERYAKAARELRQKSVDIDAELASQAALRPDPAPASPPAAR